jgi:uncharacterized protein YvpB
MRQEDNKSAWDFAKRPDKIGKILGYSMCQITSLAMAMKAVGIPQKEPQKLYPDELFDLVKLNYESAVANNEISVAKEHSSWAEDRLWEEPKAVYQLVLSKYIEGKWKISDVSKLDIKKRIDNGDPVVISLAYGDDEGHIVLIIGYTASGYLIHDPYGDLRRFDATPKMSDWSGSDGRYVEYAYGTHSLGNRWQSYLEK